MSFAADLSAMRRLLDAQFPHWAGLALTPVASSGTDNVVFRLGEDMAVRAPRVDYAEELLLKEAACLPRLKPLPLEIPEVIARGEAGEGLAAPWLVVRWLRGEPADSDRLDPVDAARTLGGFLAALQAMDATGGPAAGPGNMGRGAPLALRDVRTREWLAAIADEVDTAALLGLWDRALAAEPYRGPGVWVHGDLHAANLLQRDGRLSGVIDFGLLGVGDPAVDMAVAWTFLTAAGRTVFRDVAGADAALWWRGQGWALSVAASQLAYYRGRNAYLADQARKTLFAVLADRPG